MGDTLTKIRWADGEKNLLTACILTLAALLISLPLFSTSQILAGYDLPFHLGHIEGLAAGLSSGQFPVRVNPVQLGGYGMPTSIFYPDFFLYPLAFLRLAGISLVTCWNLGLFGINILTVFAAWWAFSLYAQSSRLGAVAALFYLGCLYRMVTMYVGAGISSALAMAFFPAALVSIWVTLRRNAAYWPAVVLFSTGVLLSHIVTSLLLIAVTLLMVLCSLSRFRFKVVRQSSGKAVGFTALLSIWYYAPLLYFHHHMGYLMKSAVSQQGVWDWTIFPLRVCDYYVGSVLILLCALLSVFLLLYRRQVRIQAKSFFTLLLVSVAILLILSHPQPWHILGSLVGVLQFPARLAVFPMTFLSMAAALGLAAVHKAHPIPYPRAIVFLLALLLYGGNFFWMSGYGYGIPPQPRGETFNLRPMPVADYLAQLDIGYSGYKDYMDEEAFQRLQQPSPEETEARMQQKFQDRVPHPETRIADVRRIGTDFVIHYRAGEADWVQLPVFWYAGERATDLDGTSQIIRKDSDGQVSVWLPQTAGTVHVWYDGLSWFHLTDLASWFGLFIFAWIATRSYRLGCSNRK